ncbi:MAG: TetR family transcriptional regulator C-terminal domain-containing protein [Aestuariivirgaceae bacterium]
MRREQLIKAAINSIAKRGLSETTMAHVTLGANLSQGTVNYHFTSKQILFVETLKYLVEEHRAQWRKNLDRSGPTPKEQLLALIDADFHSSICNRQKLSVWFAFYGETKYRAAYRDTCAEIDAERINETERLCRRLIEEGGYQHVEPDVFARGLEAFIDGLWLNILLYNKTFSPTGAKRECLAFLAATFPDHFSLTAMPTACRSE